MKNALLLTLEDRRMDDSLNAMDRVKWTPGMLKVQAIDLRMTADYLIDFISEEMTLQHRKQAQYREQ